MDRHRCAEQARSRTRAGAVTGVTSSEAEVWVASCLAHYPGHGDVLGHRPAGHPAPISWAGKSPGSCEGPHLRQPDVFLKTVVHSASRGLESSLGSGSQPEFGTMTSWVSVYRPWSMMTIFRGS